MVGVGNPESLSQSTGALQAFNIPVISASPEHADTLETEENVLTTAPDMSGQARVSLIMVVMGIKFNNMSVNGSLYYTIKMQ